jgi:hypothetical protein
LELLGLADPLQAAVKLDPKTRKTLLLDFVRTLPRSPRVPTAVVIIEDLHWIDAASEEFAEALADAVVGTTTLLIVNFRPGFTAPLMQRSHYRQINMPPLPPAQAAVLLQDHFGSDPSLALLVNIIERPKIRSSRKNLSMPQNVETLKAIWVIPIERGSIQFLPQRCVVTWRGSIAGGERKSSRSLQ